MSFLPPLTPLPEFDAPPVNETALAVDFEPIAQWGVPHFGLFWKRIRAEFPRFQVHPPLPRTRDLTGEPRALAPGVQFEIVTQPPIRCWFMTAELERLIQVQNDKFVSNWRRMAGGATYPRYAQLRPAFEQAWGEFMGFLAEENLPAPAVNQCEVSSTNHFERGVEWESFGDLARITELWRNAGLPALLKSPDTGSFTVRFPVAGGYLHVALNPAIRFADSREILQMTLVARLRVDQSQDLLDRLDRGRELVVRGFAALTTAEMHKIWKRRQ